jgi:murein DD-endopeptidase MepM/ murein hydrolase activator NlpD
MKRYMMIFNLFLLPITMVAAEQTLWVEAPKKAVAGTLVSLSIHTQSENGLTVALRDMAGKEIISSNTFPAKNSRKEGMGEEIALLGLPSTLQSGSFLLILYSGETLLWQQELSVEMGSFLKEDIPLNQKMSDLRSDDDPQKVEEAIAIHAIYNTFHRRPFDEKLSLHLPVTGGRFSAWYGDRRRYCYSDGTSALSIHSGVDIAAPVGTPISAGGEGTVVFTGPRIVTGNTVVIEYGPGVYGVFFHLDRIDIEEGSTVDADTHIGVVGMTGLATGPHLHWEIRVAGIPIDPLSLLATPLDMASSSPIQ